MPTEVTPRRERVRAETTAEIKTRAWALMAGDGVDALSLRAIARQMGMAPSAIYRYFAGRDELLTALIVDGFTDLADALGHAYDDARRPGGAEPSAADTWLAVAGAYRRWATANPTVFGLVYSSSIPGYQGTPETTVAASRVGRSLLRVMADLVDQGLVDLDAIDADLEVGLAARLAGWSVDGGQDLPPAALAAALRCYAVLHGTVHLEVNGHYPPALQGNDALFVSTMRAATASFRPLAGGAPPPAVS